MRVTTQSKWDQLTEEQREKLIVEFADCYTSYEWWDGEYERFTDSMGEIGIEVLPNEIYFSGFSCQGDGAAFKGKVKDLAKMLKHLGQLLYYEWLTNSLDNFWFESYVNAWGYTMSFDYRISVSSSPYDEVDEPLQHLMWSIDLPSESFLENLEDSIKEVFEDAANKLYRSLEEEYDYLTSNGVIKEYILDHREEDIDDCLEHG
jgi:hypothetical protein